jgi:hypothetical protein
MPFSPPLGVTFYTTDDVPVTVLSATLRRVVAFLQNQRLSPQVPVTVYHDWWEHDGLHFEKGHATFHDLFTMVETARAIFEATPDEDEVFIGIAPNDGCWYLRFRAQWNADNQSIIGWFAVTVPSELADAFRTEVVTSSQCCLAEESSEDYYRRVMV